MHDASHRIAACFFFFLYINTYEIIHGRAVCHIEIRNFLLELTFYCEAVTKDFARRVELGQADMDEDMDFSIAGNVDRDVKQTLWRKRKLHH